MAERSMVSRSPRRCRHARRPPAPLPDRRPARRAGRPRLPAPPAASRRPGLASGPSAATRPSPPGPASCPRQGRAPPGPRGRLPSLHRGAPAQAPLPLFGHRPHPARPRPGHADRAPGRGAGHRSRPPAGASPRPPSPPGGVPSPPHRRCRPRSPKRMSYTGTPASEASPTAIRPARRAAGPTGGAATRRSPTIARRSRAWPAGPAAASLSGGVGTATAPRWRPP